MAHADAVAGLAGRTGTGPMATVLMAMGTAGHARAAAMFAPQFWSFFPKARCTVTR